MKLKLVTVCLAVGIGIVAIGYVIPLIALAIIAPARSQEAPQRPAPCGPLARIEQNLARQFSETQSWSGSGGPGQEIRLYTTASRTGSWTMLAVKDDQGCVMASGGHSRLGNMPVPGGYAL